MKRVTKMLMQSWSNLGPRYLPFADAASDDLPLSRLLRLSLFQASSGMALVLLVGTLNRVMIVELHVPASIVSVMISLPIIFAPFRALIGFRSDNHKSAFGWRRVPFIWMGTLVQFGGLSIMPFALLVLSGAGQSAQAPVWIGWAASGLAFLLVGAGIHITQTVGLALATDLAPEVDQPKVVGLMYVMQLLGMIVSALVFGLALNEFSPGKLIQVIQAAAIITLLLNVISLWKQEPRGQVEKKSSREPSFLDSWHTFAQGGNAKRRLVAVGFGTMAFSMNEVLLEPYGGQILGMSVSDTTMLTAILALGGLIGFSWASRVLGKGTDPFYMATMGALVGIPAFLLIALSAPLAMTALFLLGTFLIGFGGGLFSHGTLTATMQLAPSNQRGLALGAWGAVQATAAGIAIGLGGVIRDIVVAIGATNWLPEGVIGPATGYSFVYFLEIGLLIATIFSMATLLPKRK
ncbi:PucC family protein [Polynucleobacter sp. MWH-Berg-3C6]|uniref:PucC family protein n=1 Tax=Polynucleobacter sp. MWH-Berg-3C6 TaxID=1855882 RepID=UPI002105BDCB|nr:PucC family protein [Polynucleobacter sp. MWH-Berg-3C6]MBU3550128.1 PucC family protein [Polynucleobacter sp. MWH-Berg-3C6]